MLNYSNLRKGNVIKNNNGHTYDVLSTRKDRDGQQDLLLKDKKYGEIVVAKGWDCNSHDNEKIGSWNQGEYLGNLTKKELKIALRSFKKGKRKHFLSDDK